MSVGYLAGAFDVITVADLDVIGQARALCSRLLVGVVTDDDAERWLGRLPMAPVEERMAVLRHIEGVADVVVHGEPAATSIRFAAVGDPAPPDRTVRWLSPEPETAPTDLPSGARTPRRAGQRVGYVPGAWDMFHVGHLNILHRARARCDHLVVGVTTDEALVGVKGRLPVVPLAERVAVVSALTMVDEVVVDHSISKRGAFEAVGFDVLFKGSDWQGTAKGARLESEMAALGVTVSYFPYTPHTSSSRLRERLTAR